MRNKMHVHDSHMTRVHLPIFSSHDTRGLLPSQKSELSNSAVSVPAEKKGSSNRHISEQGTGHSPKLCRMQAVEASFTCRSSYDSVK
jgi:hypothetical protein